MKWAELSEEQKKNCYDSYVGEMRYEWGDDAKVITYEEFCMESEELGEPLI